MSSIINTCMCAHNNTYDQSTDSKKSAIDAFSTISVTNFATIPMTQHQRCAIKPDNQKWNKQFYCHKNHYIELKRQLKESADQIKGDAVQLERHKEQISQLKIEMERLTKGKFMQSAVFAENL